MVQLAKCVATVFTSSISIGMQCWTVAGNSIAPQHLQLELSPCIKDDSDQQESCYMGGRKGFCQYCMQFNFYTSCFEADAQLSECISKQNLCGKLHYLLQGSGAKFLLFVITQNSLTAYWYL